MLQSCASLKPGAGNVVAANPQMGAALFLWQSVEASLKPRPGAMGWHWGGGVAVLV